MKKLFILTLTLLGLSTVHAQNPVTWTFAAKKIADKTYEVQMTAKVQAPWSIYSQSTPEGGPLPTRFSFAKNPLVQFVGPVKEQGALGKKFEEVFAVEVFYYKEKVNFIQRVKLKNNIKTKLSGTLEYMACNSEQCLPPTEIPFSIALQ